MRNENGEAMDEEGSGEGSSGGKRTAHRSDRVVTNDDD
jgi:hypothetical protein